MKKYRYQLNKLDCANCALKLENYLKKDKKLNNVIVNFSTLMLSFETDIDKDLDIYIQKLISEVEPGVIIIKNNLENNNVIKKDIFYLIGGLLCAFFGFFVQLPWYFNSILVIISYFILLSNTIKNAFDLLVKSRAINENFLITISCIGAYLIGEHMEGLMVITLYSIGKILEEKAINNSRKSIKELMNIRPEFAVLEDGRVVEPSDVKINDVILVKVGEKIALDGVIVNGNTLLDTSSLTGESKLLEVFEGSEVLSGAINTKNLIKVKVTKDYENSTVSKILDLVENATDKKAKTETFVNSVAKIYTPVVFILAILVAVFLPFISSLTYQESIYRALIFLVISCPCAIAISVPLSYFSGIGKASKEGILIKGSEYLDSLKDIKKTVFDKTGTITTGNFGVTEVKVFDSKYNKENILMYASLGESFSIHPIAKSILDSYKGNLDTSNVKDFKEESGLGISFSYDNKKVFVGNKTFVGYDDSVEDGTSIFVKINEDIIGCLVLNDMIKDNAFKVFNELKNENIEIEMFTGDNDVVAKNIAEKLNISYKANLLPQEKYYEMEKLLKNKLNGKISFVGDGINDAPVLALADIGISMGGVGSSAAIEASDVVIMNDDLSKINAAFKISKKTFLIIKQNLIFAISIKVIILLLSIFGLSGMWQAIFADVGVTLITILNTLRILK